MNEPLGMILIDVADESTIDSASTGHAVRVCHGPDDTHVCPMLTGDRCPMAEEAHGVVFALDLDRPTHRSILAAYKQNLREDVPIGVSVRPGQMTQYADLLQGSAGLGPRSGRRRPRRAGSRGRSSRRPGLIRGRRASRR